jgi:hypothetical protein
MSRIEVIDEIVNILEKLPVENAYTGSLNNLKQKSYIKVYEVTKVIGKLRNEKVNIINNSKKD